MLLYTDKLYISKQHKLYGLQEGQTRGGNQKTSPAGAPAEALIYKV